MQNDKVDWKIILGSFILCFVVGVSLIVPMVDRKYYTGIIEQNNNSLPALGAGWWDSDWDHFRVITIDNTKIDTTLNGFPVLLNISDAIADECDSGNSIRFLDLDNSTEYPYEIESWVDGEDRSVWVNVSTVKSGSDTKFLMYYGNSGASDNQDKYAVWDDDYVFVSHMNDSTTSTISDSTAYGNNGYKLGSNEPAEVSTVVGEGQDFDNSNDYIHTGTDASLDRTNYVTLEAYLSTNNNRYCRLMYKTDAWQFYTYTDGRLFGYYYDTGGQRYREDTAGGVMQNSGYEYVAFTFDTSDNAVRFWHNASEIAASGSSGPTAGNDNGNQYLGGYPSESYTLDGIVTEMRTSRIKRNDSWIKASYYTISRTANFITYGGEQIPPVANTAPVQSNPLVWDGTTADINHTGVIIPVVSFNITIADQDADKMTLTVRTNQSGTWQDVNTSGNLGNGTYSNNTNVSWVDSYNTKYWISFNLTDGTDWDNNTYYFTTRSNTNPVNSNPYPGNGSVDVEVNPTLNITINDADGQDMNITWYWLSNDFNKGTSSDVSTGFYDSCTRMPIHRLSCYAQGLFWVFYVENKDGDGRKYKTSADGITWSDATTVCGGHGADFSIWVNGSTIHYVRAYLAFLSMYTQPVYRRGTLNANGTITWLSAEQSITDVEVGLYDTTFDPSICVDSDGYPWVTWINTTNYNPVVSKSSTKDGTWTNDVGFPYELNNSKDDHLPIVVPLTDGKVYVVYGYSYNSGSGNVCGKLWDGNSWGDEEIASTSNVSGDYFGRFSVVSDGDDVHVVFLNVSNQIKHIKRTYGVGWGSENLVDNGSSLSSPIISKTGSNTMICLWANDYVVYYKHYDGTDWADSNITWFTDTNMRNDSISCFYENMSERVGLLYSCGRNLGTYDIKFNFLNHWMAFGTNTSVGNGIYHQINSNFSSYSTTYYWKVSVNDGTDTNNSDIFHFTTEELPRTWQQLELHSGWFTFGNTSSNEQIQSGWFAFQNTTPFTQIQSGWFTFGNTTSTKQVLSGWFSFQNTSSNQQMLSGWFTFSNATQHTQIQQGWFTFSNTSIFKQVLSGWFTFDGQQRVFQQIQSGWFTFGNTSANEQLQSGYFTFGNTSTFTQVQSGWFTFSNTPSHKQVVSGWFSFQNTTIFQQTQEGWFTFSNTSTHAILEPSFETVNNWTYYENDTHCSGGQSDSGVTHGSKAYGLAIGDDVGTGYCKVYQTHINLTNITHIYVDLYLNSDVAIDVPAYVSLRVNGDILYERRIGQTETILIRDVLTDVSAYDDYCTLEYRLNQTDVGFYDEGIFVYIDNIRTRIWRTTESGWFTFSNTSSNEQILSGWFAFQNTTPFTQIQSGWFTFGNTTSYQQIQSGWFTFEGRERETQQIQSGWFAFQNTTPFTQIQSGWFGFGNTTIFHQQQSGWFTFENTSTTNYIESGWFIFSNTTIHHQIVSGWFNFSNSTLRIWEQILPGWFTFSNTTNWGDVDNTSGWFNFSNSSFIPVANFEFTIEGVNVICISTSSNPGSIDGYRWNVSINEIPSGSTGWINDVTGSEHSFSFPEGGSFHITLCIRWGTDTDCITKGTGYNPPNNDIYEPDHYNNCRSCEDAGYYWYDDECHKEPEPLPWNEEKELPEAGGHSEGMIEIFGWNVDIGFIVFFAIVGIFCFLIFRKKKKKKE